MTLPIFSFCGASDSGKTTLVAGVVSHIRHKGFKVGVIKHHGHARPLPEPEKPKDTDKLRQAGSMITALSQAGGLHIDIAPELAPRDPQEIARRFYADMDLVLIEGYKSADLDKIEVIGPGKRPILPENGRIAALAVRGELSDPPSGMAILDAGRPDEVADFVLDWLSLKPDS